MLKYLVLALLPIVVLVGVGYETLVAERAEANRSIQGGTLEKLAVSSGSAAIELDLNKISGRGVEQSSPTLYSFEAGTDTLFTSMAFNGEFRGFMPSSLPIITKGGADLPAKLAESLPSLSIERLPFGSSEFELAIRDAKNGYTFFNIEGFEFEFEPITRQITIRNGRLRLSEEYAAELGRKDDTSAIVGSISLDLSLRPIEVSKIDDSGEVISETLPPDPMSGSVPGPDVVVGDLSSLQQLGSSDGTYVGLAVATDSCNYGTIGLNWSALPNNDHPVIPQNLYRVRGGASNDETIEQIGLSQLKHAFTALQQNLCGLGCSPGSPQLGSGCSDPYSTSLNGSQTGLGSRAWVNPFTGAFPRGDSATPPNSHSGHTHQGPSHRILTPVADLNTALNTGATYFVEAQYVTPHEYAWCQANPGQCNMYNNASYRRYTVNGTGSPFTFSPVGSTVREKPAITAWTGATMQRVEPERGVDGVAFVAYKVSNPSPGIYHYEYAIYNQNLDRSISSFSLPVPDSLTLTDIGFHAPPQHPGWNMDGTLNSQGYSSTPWAVTRSGNSFTWATESIAQNPNANAIRWGTMYNFRFRSTRPPQTVNATVGFFKTGAPVTVAVAVPSSPAVNVSVGGRVLTNNRAVSFAKVTLTDSLGNARSTFTTSFGYYRFDNVLTGSNYTVTVEKRNYTFTPQSLTPLNGQLDNLNFFSPRN